ncbi:hypothetical protein [Emticicia aquatilis]|uniref:hypothetical protein n=1 Tax=Emticicia aquatilis TaxID=1537369 RepID=UPI00166297FE|nr:hypothetical protein [Emticicia aquatilis]
MARVLFGRDGRLLGGLAGVSAPCLAWPPSGSGWWSYLARALAAIAGPGGQNQKN